MNRFLNKKKGNDDSLSPPHSGKKWRKGKKVPVEEQKPAKLNLSEALPSTEEFRTSLLMPNLSARFSMLREQDDPSSKLGKASDDSVLSPRRQSRLVDYGFSSSALDNITEVASIKSSIRPPFAREDTRSSCASEETCGTDLTSVTGSVMNRSRQGESNVLFGGRQKVYKVAASSAKMNSGTGEKALAGKQLYEDDLNLSAFQRYRQQQKGAEAAERTPSDEGMESPGSDTPDAQSESRRGSDHEDKSVAEPALQGDGVGLGLALSTSESTSDKRESDSTTASFGRTSTAATSVASQTIGAAMASPTALPGSTTPAAPQLERSLTKRRLYEQGLERDRIDQQTSVLTRLNSIHRLRSPTMGSITSPPTLAHSRSIGQIGQQARGFQPFALQPNSPTTTKHVPPPLKNLGSLNKADSTNCSPAPSYPQSPISPTMSDAEYRTLHAALEPGDRGKATAMGAFNRPKNQFDEDQYLQRQQLAQQSRDADMMRKNSVDSAGYDPAKRSTSSRASERSRSASVSSKMEPDTNKALSIFQNAAVKNRVAHGESPDMPPQAPFVSETQRTFFGDISASEDEEEDIAADFERGPFATSSFTMAPSNGLFTPTALPSVSEHPALRRETSNIPEVDEEEAEAEAEAAEEESVLPPKCDTSNVPRPSDSVKDVKGMDMDSPTMGSQDMVGMGGLIHQHLRSSSDQSSIYPGAAGASPAKSRYGDRQCNSTYSAANNWDMDDLDSYYGDALPRGASNSSFVPAKGQPLSQANSKANIDNSSRPSTRDSTVADGVSWQNELKKQHQREASTATQLERDAFEAELAARQKAIQEKMKSLVENESRGPSPAPSVGGALKAFGMLKTKASQETMRKDSKATRIFSASESAERNFIYEDCEDESIKSPPQFNKTWGPSSDPQWPLGPSTDLPAVPDNKAPPARSPSRQSAWNRQARSNSATSRGRSHSRTGPREEFGSPEVPPMMPQAFSQRPSISSASTPQPSSRAESRGRLRSNSKAGSYFDQRQPSSQAGTPISGRATPSGGSTIGGMPFPSSVMSRSTTMSRDGTSTPTSTKSAPIPHLPMGKTGGLLRKKTISKADISDPKLVSSTSNIDTVELPVAAKMNHNAHILPLPSPPIPPLNPRRRMMSNESERYNGTVSPPPGVAPPMGHPAAADGWTDVRSESRQYPRAVRSQESFDVTPPARFDAIGSPVLNEAGMF